MPRQPKTAPKKAGRPPLPKGDAKAVMLRVRVTSEELRAVESLAKAKGQTVSEWLRSKVAEATAA
jgi:hypothetical protein